jgi:hypothetical protein
VHSDCAECIAAPELVMVSRAKVERRHQAEPDRDRVRLTLRALCSNRQHSTFRSHHNWARAWPSPADSSLGKKNSAPLKAPSSVRLAFPPSNSDEPTTEVQSVGPLSDGVPRFQLGTRSLRLAAHVAVVQTATVLSGEKRRYDANSARESANSHHFYGCSWGEDLLDGLLHGNEIRIRISVLGRQRSLSAV